MLVRQQFANAKLSKSVGRTRTARCSVSSVLPKAKNRLPGALSSISHRSPGEWQAQNLPLGEPKRPAAQKRNLGPRDPPCSSIYGSGKGGESERRGAPTLVQRRNGDLIRVRYKCPLNRVIIPYMFVVEHPSAAVLWFVQLML